MPAGIRRSCVATLVLAMRLSSTLFHVKNTALLVLLWTCSAWMYATLTDDMPTHFSLMGTVSDWAEPTWSQWFLLPAVGSGIALLMYVVGFIIPRYPSWVVVPNPKTYSALTNSRQDIVLQTMQHILYGIAALLLALFLVLQWGTYEVALTGAEALPTYARVVLWGSLPFLILLGPVVVWLIHRTIARLHAEQR